MSWFANQIPHLEWTQLILLKLKSNQIQPSLSGFTHDIKQKDSKSNQCHFLQLSKQKIFIYKSKPKLCCSKHWIFSMSVAIAIHSKAELGALAKMRNTNRPGKKFYQQSDM